MDEFSERIHQRKLTTIISIPIALCFLGFFAVCGYGCQVTTRHYYEAMENCTDKGGTWIPTNGQANAACVIGGMVHD